MTHVPVRELVLEAALFDSVRSKAPRAWSGPLGQLLGDEPRVVPHKSHVGCFSAVRYRPGASRGRAGVELITALVFDFDHVSRADSRKLLDALAGRASCIYTSYSHLKDGRDDLCYRVVLPCSRAMTPAEFRPVWRTVDAELGGLADPSAKDESRLWYLPSCPAGRAATAQLSYRDGAILDVDQVLARADEVPKAARRQASTSAGRAASVQLDPVPEGGRSAHLMSLAGAMRRRGAGEAPIVAALLAESAARCVPPLPEGEVRAIAASVCQYEPGSPLVTANLTDMGNAERLVAHVGKDLRYVHLSETWFEWTGKRWQKDETGAAMRRACATIRAAAIRADALEEDKERARLLRHALKSESAARLHSMLRLATSLLPVTPDQLDRSAWLLNCANGTLDLRSGELRPHDRADLLTRLAPVHYDGAAACPLWEAFLHQVMDGSEEMVAFLQRAVGYSLTGSTAEQVLFLLHGVGANGKSTFIETIRAMLGDYSTQADFTTFLRQQGEGVRNDVARLVGARFVSAVEAEGGKPLAEAMVKQLTGGDTVTARFLFKEFFEFTPVFKLWLAANSRPTVRGTDNGIWRRIRLVPFTVTIPPAERDRDLGRKLAAELPGILAWAVRGCLQWQADGLGVPADVEAATEAYRDAMDVLGGFITESCVVRPGAQVTSADLYSAYTAWCEGNGERPVTRRKMGLRLSERGFERRRGSGGRHTWMGVGLQAARDPAASD